MAKHDCLICGKEGYQSYYFCLEHLKMRTNGELQKCDKCNKWYIINEGCKCQKEITAKENIESKIQKIEEKKCSICGKPSNDFDLCYPCYRNKTEEALKKDIETLIQSEKDSGIDVRNKWPAKIRTQNGIKVRSHAECRIADWLYAHNINFEYEKMVFLKTDVNKFLLSDFYIPDAKIFIEYWGYKDRETYNKRRNEKKTIYDTNGQIMKDLEDHHLEVLDDTMKEILLSYLPEETQKKLY